MKILVVEDEQRARMGLVNLIEEIGGVYKVIGEASNALKALEMIKIQEPDVIFTDIRMPYMDGLEFVRMIRSQHGKSRFVFVTAYAEFDYAKEAITLGVDEFLVKPVIKKDVETVLHKISDLLQYGEQYTWDKEQKLKDHYPDIHPLIKDVLDIIESNYASKLNQQEIATRLGISPEYLSYLFSREIGRNFASFIREYRVEMAKDLLRKKISDCKEVPYKVGFSDPKYFNKVFREVTEQSVSEFTRKFR